MSTTAEAVPKVIKTEEENERALAILESLMKKGEQNLTPKNAPCWNSSPI